MATKGLLLALFIFFFSCNNQSKIKYEPIKNPCIVDLSYDPRYKTFNPALIKITIVDSDTIITNSLKSKTLTEVFFYAISKKDQFNFRKTDYYEIKNDTVIIGVLTNYFKADSSKKWLSKDVEVILNNDVGLIIKNDTIHVKQCN